MSSCQLSESFRFDDILQRFMVEFVAHRMSGTGDGDFSAKQAGERPSRAEALQSVTFSVSIAYQREPTFRVVLPSGQQLGYRHCDADYHHPPVSCCYYSLC